MFQALLMESVLKYVLGWTISHIKDEHVHQMVCEQYGERWAFGRKRGHDTIMMRTYQNAEGDMWWLCRGTVDNYREWKDEDGDVHFGFDWGEGYVMLPYAREAFILKLKSRGLI